MSNRAVIFDADDTLWMTMPLYKVAKERFYCSLAELGFNKRNAEQEFERIDLENSKLLGLSKERFPNSMGKTYELLCKQSNVEINLETRKRLEGIGRSVFEQPSELVPGVEEALRILRHHFKLLVASSGDPEIQLKRFQNSGVSHYFEKMYVFPNKTKKEIRQILVDFNLVPNQCWIIGNSIRSDINPALELGINAIWVPYKTWSYEEAIASNDRFHQQYSILDAANFILNQQGVID